MDQYGASLREIQDNPKYKENYPKIKKAADAIVKIQMEWHPFNDQVGTGSMVSSNPPLLFTALHIIPDQKTLNHSGTRFHYNESNSIEEIIPLREIIYSNARLDFMLIKLEQLSIRYTVINIENRSTFNIGEEIFMIHHPTGRTKRIHLQDVYIDPSGYLGEVIQIDCDKKRQNVLIQEYKKKASIWIYGSTYRKTSCSYNWRFFWSATFLY